MVHLPVVFRKPLRGEGSCESVYLEVNEGNATCLRSSHMTDFTSDGINGVLVFNGANSNNCCKNWGGKQTLVCNTLDANYYKGLGSNQDRCGVLVVEGGSELEHLVATIWKPTTANGGCADNMRLDRVGVETAAAVCARYYKGISAHGCNCVVVGDDELLKGFNTMPDGSCRTIKANQAKVSAANFMLQTSRGLLPCWIMVIWSVRLGCVS